MQCYDCGMRVRARVVGTVVVSFLAVHGCTSTGVDSEAPVDAAVPLASGDAAPRAPSEQPPGWDSEIRPFELPDLDPSPNVAEFALEARVADVEVKKGTVVKAWTYDGHLPGPLIRAKKGDRVKIHFTNSLPDRTTVHWHGLRVPNDMDGVDPEIMPGQKVDFEFDVPDAGTYWYHSHVHSTAQVGFGLYGAFIIEDPADRDLGDETALVFSDMSLAADGGLQPGNQDGMLGDYFGREGALLLVNGKPMPNLKGRVGVPQRWRIVNAARARYLKFGVPNADVMRIGGDNGLVAAPEAARTVTLAPGERAELQVVPKVPSNGPLKVMWEDSDRFHTGAPRPSEPFMTYEVVDLAPPTKRMTPLPASLRAIEAIATDGARERVIELMERKEGQATVLGINGLPFAESIPLSAKVGDTEVWDVRNLTGFDHPFHIHGFSFQVLDVEGASPKNREWKDTVNVSARSRIRLVLKWDNRPGMWMFHCHILDHTELGMMAMVHLMR